MFLLRDIDVVVTLLETDAHAGELRRDDAQVLERYVADRQFRLVHGGHADEAAHLDHVGQQRVLRAAERLDALDGQQVRGDARDACAHAVEHLAQLLQVGLAGGVVDRREALGHHGGHHDVGRTGHRCFVQQHVGSFQLAAFDHEKFVGDVEIELRTQLLEPEEVGIQPPPADFVAAGFGYVTHAEARQHGADEHHRAAQARAALPVVLRAEVVEIYFAGAKTVCILRELFDLDAHAPQQFDELHDVEDLGNVVHRDPFGGQQRGAEYLQRFVLGALGRDAAVEPVASFDFENRHNP